MIEGSPQSRRVYPPDFRQVAFVRERLAASSGVSQPFGQSQLKISPVVTP